jgi:hypothetical protein
MANVKGAWKFGGCNILRENSDIFSLGQAWGMDGIHYEKGFDQLKASYMDG